MALSKGKRRVALEDLGPAVFNRFGAATSGRRCRELTTRIIRIEGLAVYRYTAGWCVEPNPDDPLEVYRHGSAMAQNDALLPKLVEKPLKGLFRKTHLHSALLKSKRGTMTYDNSAELVDPSKVDNEEWRITMAEGMFVEVFSYSDYIANKDKFMALMASGNFDAGFALAEDEIQMLCRVKLTLDGLVIPSGMSHFEAVAKQVGRLAGSRWTDNDLVHFYNYAKTVSGDSLCFASVYQRYICDPSTFQVASGFYHALSLTPVKHQTLRLAALVRQQTSDVETECSSARGVKIANAIKTQHFEYWKEPAITRKYVCTYGHRMKLLSL